MKIQTTDIYTTDPQPYSRDDAWLRAAELQRKYVTRVWRDSQGWRVGYAPKADYLKMREGNKE